MADTGFLFPGTTAGIRAVTGGAYSWENPGNIVADDGNTALYSTSDAQLPSLGLAASNFDFSVIPAGATIDGIEVRVGDYIRTASVFVWTRVALILADDSDGSITNNGLVLPSTVLQTNESGGATDLWDETIDRADVQDVDWGFFVAANCDVNFNNLTIDFMQMKVYYTESAEAGPPDAWAVQTQRNSRKSGRYI
jgi:hypothetical protein